MAQLSRSENLAIFAYGSLLSDPGEKIAPHIIARVAYPSPWPIEYARRAKLRGYGPTLVIHPAGGIVRGQLLVLNIQPNAIDELSEWLGKERACLRASGLNEWNAVTSAACFTATWNRHLEMKP